MNIQDIKPTVEDSYIAYLSGQKNSTNVFEQHDRNKASLAQNHPIRDRLLYGTLCVTIPGIIASALNTISMSSRTACETCAINQSLFFANQIFCHNNDIQHLLCRISICVHDILETVSNHYILIGAVVLGVAVTVSSATMHELAKHERAAENELIGYLKNRFGRIACRLSDREKDPAISAIAEDILHRRFSINEEVANLKLPSLTWKDIELITAPVFQAAERIQINVKAKAA